MIRYRIMDPTGNITILVETPVEEASQPVIAEKLMALEKDAEQAGFLSAADDCDIALRMAGGEFCGNAAMSSAVLCALKSGTENGVFFVRVSGSEKPVRAEVARLPGGSYRGTVEMPRPRSIGMTEFPGHGEFPVVHFDGISHAVIEQPMKREEAEKLIRAWGGTQRQSAFGMIFLDPSYIKLTPLVYVPGADTLFWENSCASGTAAAGAYLAAKRGCAVDLAFEEPGGLLQIQASPSGPLLLTGTVTERACKTVRRADL